MRMSSDIIKANGGEIKKWKRRKGEGPTFTIQLPLKQS